MVFSLTKSAQNNFSVTAKNLFFGATFFIASFLLVPFAAHAATLTVSPVSGSYDVGQTFSVSVSAASPNQTLNAASASLSYSRDTMEIVSVSKSPSIFSLWVQEPSYSNASGIASFEGVVLNPGFTGASGRLITYTFRAKSAGAGSVRVTNGSILANDGNGTDIFTGAGSASFTFTTKTPTPIKPSVTAPTVIDGELPPILQIEEVSRDDLTDPVAKFEISVVNTRDVFKKFQIRIDQGEPVVWDDDGTGIFTTESLTPGPHTILVKTLDGKRVVTGYIDFLVDALQQPKLEYYSKLSTTSDAVVVYGTAKAGETVTVAFKNGAEVVYSENVVSDAAGKFMLMVSGKIPRGVYIIDAFVKSNSGARSPAITDLKVRVVSNYFVKIGPAVIEGYMLAFILCIIGLMVVIFELFRHKKHVPVTVVTTEPEKPKRRRKMSA